MRRPVRLLSPLLAGWIVATSLSAAELPESDTFELWHTAILQQVSDAKISPDGQRIAYLLSVPRRPLAEDSGPAWSELHLMLEDGTSLPFVTGEVNVGDLDWTPAGELSFLTQREGDDQRSLYVMAPDGGEARRLLAHDSAVGAYSWSPNGEKVAFLATQAKPEERETLEEKGFNQIVYEEDSPYTRVWLTSVLGGEVVGEGPRQLDIEGSATAVHFSPDGQTLMVSVTPTPAIDDSYVKIKVHLVDIESGDTIRVIDNPGKLGTVEWSPDGEHLAMISAADLNDPAAGRLMSVAASDGTPVDLLPGLLGDVSSFAWKSDDTLVYVADIGTLREVGTVTLSGERLILIERSTPILTLTDVSPGGRAAFTGDSPAHPSELFTLEPGSTEPKRWTSSNDWLDDVSLARQEVIGFQARDGLDLEGVLIYPLEYEQGTRYPLMLVVHGGPESHHNNGWLTSYSSFGQAAAARGFAVFFTNYRGSTGRGVEFSKISQAGAAGPEFDDLIDAVDHLIDVGLVDEDRVGITGGSYGGYASAWGATYYSDRFAAAVPFVGISDNISVVGTTDIPHEMYEVHHRKWLWEDWEYFAKSSPIYYASRNRTPTLILHGKDDPRVHPSQSMELHRHLKVLAQAPVRLVFYPGEGHGNRKSAARFDYHVRVMRWMEHYLKGPGGDPPPYEIDYSEFLPWAQEEEGSEVESSDGATGS